MYNIQGLSKRIVCYAFNAAAVHQEQSKHF